MVKIFCYIYHCSHCFSNSVLYLTVIPDLLLG